MKTQGKPAFDASAFLTSAGIETTVTTYEPGKAIFSQGDSADSVLYVEKGSVKLAVVSARGKEAVVAMIGPGDFFGEQALAGHPVRLARATPLSATTVMIIPKDRMTQLLHEDHAFSDRFIAHMLARNFQSEADLVDQLFNSSEKRLARALLMLARYGRPEHTHRELPKISQETLAEMIGTTRSRVNFFMNSSRNSDSSNTTAASRSMTLC
jgi:CRP/FNR family transcriptional regulator, cyclic AMP receptor protein